MPSNLTVITTINDFYSEIGQDFTKKLAIEKKLFKYLETVIISDYISIVKERVLIDLKNSLMVKDIPQSYTLTVFYFNQKEMQGQLHFKITKINNQKSKYGLGYLFDVKESGEIEIGKMIYCQG